MKVRDIMTKNVIACQAQTTVEEAARLMYLNGLTGLPVLNEQDEIVGIITEQDLVKVEGHLHLPITFTFLGSIVSLGGGEVPQQLERLLASQVKELMTKEVITIAPEAPIEDLAELFLHKKVNPVPVVTDDKLVGIVSRADIVKLIAGETKEFQPPVPRL